MHNDILDFIQNSFPAGVSRKILSHYERTGLLPKRINIQTDLRGDCETYYPQKAYAARMFAQAKAAVTGCVCGEVRA